MVQTVEQSRSRWRLVVICALGQNLVMGLNFGTFGPLLIDTEQHFGIARATASLGMSVITIAIGVFAALIGPQLNRLPIRLTMMAASLISAAAYTGLALAGSFAFALLCYALVGLGIAVLGVLAPLHLIGRAFDKRRGTALSLANLPLLLFVMPYIAGELLPEIGRTVLLLSISICFVAFAPILRFLPVDLIAPPADEDGTVGGARKSAIGARAGEMKSGQLLASPIFWLCSLAIAILSASGIVLVVHVVPFGVSKDMQLADASGLLSTYSGAGILGTILFGRLLDRFDAAFVLALACAIPAAVWVGLYHLGGPGLYVAVILVGICTTPLVTLQQTALAQFFGPVNASKAMGYSYFIKVPFNLSLAPLAGLAFDITGDYELPFAFLAGLLALAVLSCLILRWAALRLTATPKAA